MTAHGIGWGARREWTTKDKAEWGHGEWQQEPDKVQWVDKATGLDCLIVRGPSGALCGYVGVAPGHPYHGLDYFGCPEGCSESCCNHSPESRVEVHGGLTFSAPCDEGRPDGEGICHVPLPGRPADVWWLGFDCAHYGDVSPAYAAKYAFAFSDGYYKSVGYVRCEVARLAERLASVATGAPQ